MNFTVLTMLIPRLRFDFLRQDISAGFVVFLVALPLCLGIAVASETPPISGLITGIVAGLLVAFLSGSELSVSGPAAGLAVTIISARSEIGAFDGLLVAAMLAGLFQILLGTIRAGLLATFFPSAVIKGMLAGIGIIIIFKQFPHAIGWKSPFNPTDGMFCLFSPFCLGGLWGQMTATGGPIDMAAVIISSVSLYLLLAWPVFTENMGRLLKAIPGPLMVVIFAITFNFFLLKLFPQIALTAEDGQLVILPPISSFQDLFKHGPSDIYTWLTVPAVWSNALIIALIGSVETLLSIEALDKLDPLRRASRPNRELTAQGIGNIAAGALGGIPMTSVVVRSSTNVYAGARTRISAFVHGALLFISVLIFPTILNQIPLAALSAILIFVGYKLANTKLIRDMWHSGLDQFLPFIVTAAGVVLFDLLTGVFVGTIFGLIVILIMNHHSAFTIVHDGKYYLLRFSKDVNFLQKITLKRALARLPDHSDIAINYGGAMFVDHDILELIEDFKASAADRHIEVDVLNAPTIKFDLLSALRKRAIHE